MSGRGGVIESGAADSAVRAIRADAYGRAGGRDWVTRRALAAADVVAIMVALGLAMRFGSLGRATLEDWALAIPTLPGWIALFKIYGLYDRDAKRVSHSTIDDVPWIFHALLVGALGLWLYYHVTLSQSLILEEGIEFCIFGGVAIFAARAFARWVVQVATPPDRVLFLGGGPMTRLLIHKMRAHPEYGLKPVGYVDVDSAASDDLDRKVPYLGGVDDLADICARSAIDRLIVAAPAIDEGALTELIRSTEGLNVRVGILPQLVEVIGPSAEIDDVEGVAVLGLTQPTMTRSSRFVKRCMDLAITAPVLLLALLPMAVIAVAVKVTSPGPVLFAQERVGRGGRRFRMYKFRTMVADAERREADLKGQSAHSVWLLLDHDPRVTPLGRTLRHLSLDELPQLWNVLKGDMSLVGPRPMPPSVDEKISGWGRRRLDLTPGITGLWQVLGRTKIPFEEMVKLDYLYVTNWSLWQDVRLLVRTLPVVVRRQGVN